MLPINSWKYAFFGYRYGFYALKIYKKNFKNEYYKYKLFGTHTQTLSLFPLSPVDPDLSLNIVLLFRSDLIETLHDELSMASDGMNTKRQIKRPIAGQKSFFDAIQVISDRCLS